MGRLAQKATGTGVQRKREKNIEFNRTALNDDYVSFIIPAYFTDDSLPEGVIRSPRDRQHILVPAEAAPAFEQLLSRAEHRWATLPCMSALQGRSPRASFTGLQREQLRPSSNLVSWTRRTTTSWVKASI